MLYGYARISNPKQSIDRQIRNINAKYLDAVIVDEAFTGTTSSRPKWQRLFSHVKSGDQIVFDSVSRMSRNAEDGFRDYEALYYRALRQIQIIVNPLSFSEFRGLHLEPQKRLNVRLEALRVPGSNPGDPTKKMRHCGLSTMPHTL